MTERVTYAVVNGVAWLTLDRPEGRHALDRAARAGLLAGMRRFAANAPLSVRAAKATAYLWRSTR